ncbi:MAG: hypothetical protein ACREIA_04135 [Opitutaceae bacterium]
MKHSALFTVFAAAVVSCASLPAAHAAVTLEERRGYVDLGEFTAPGSGGQFVEINVQGVLLSLASRILAEEEPAIAEIIRGLHSVRVNVVSIDDSNREALVQRADALRGTLESNGWSRVAAVLDAADNVAMREHADVASANAFSVCVLVLEGNDLVIASGRVDPAPLIPMLAEKVGKHMFSS